MNDQILKTMPEYVQKLPKEVQDLIFEGLWQERTEEIAIKYGLSSEQTDILIDKVLYILIGLEQPDGFLESITTELFLSRLQAEQILEELDNRVFDYAASQIEKASESSEALPKIEKKPIAPPSTTPTISVPRYAPPPVSETKVAEHKAPEAPLNLPGVPMEEMLPAPKEVKEEKTESRQDRIDWSKFAKKEEVKEPVQQPISVPRLTPSDTTPASFAPAPAPNPATVPEKPVSMADVKLNTAISSSPTPDTSKKYTVDPYREPIE